MYFQDTMNASLPADDTPDWISRDIHTIGRVTAIPTLLKIVCDTTGMRFAAVARVTDKTWTVCAVRDALGVGFIPGSTLDVEKTLCVEAMRQRQPIVIDHASADPTYHSHPVTRLFRMESYVSMPIVLADGRHFGNLCAFDHLPAKVATPTILEMFKDLAALIAMQYEDEARQLNAQDALRDERASSELREQFIAILGHDLRNPLQAILASSELLGRKLADPVSAGMASRIKANAKRMSSLIDDVLDFARGRLGGGIGLNIVDCRDVNSGLQAVVTELQDGNPERQIHANIIVQGVVRCDLARLQQVLSNLIGNAIRHGSSKSAIQVDAGGDEHDLILRVWNAGEPIPPDSIDKIFSPFWRQSTSAKREGLGLGLHICSQIVRAHHGTMSVSSDKETGTQFTARLPRLSF